MDEGEGKPGARNWARERERDWAREGQASRERGWARKFWGARERERATIIRGEGQLYKRVARGWVREKKAEERGVESRLSGLDQIWQRRHVDPRTETFEVSVYQRGLSFLFCCVGSQYVYLR